MRKLIYVVIAAVLAYGGYWFAGSRAVLAGVEQALGEMKAAGRADYAAVGLQGFPSRFDITVDAPRLVSADGGVEWSAPFIQVFTLSYRPNHIIAVWPNEQTLRLNRETIGVTTADMRASATFGLSADLPLDHMEMVAKDGVLTSDFGWSAPFAEARFATRQAGSEAAHDMGVEVLGVLPDIPGLPPAFAPAAAGPAHFRVDVTVQLTGPLDRKAAENGVRPEAIMVRSVTGKWGPLEFSANGDLTVTPAGVPEGRVETETRGWREIVPLLVAAGAVRPELAQTVENGLQAIAQGGGDPDVLKLPLVIQGGAMSLGPVPLGPAPRFGP